MINQSLSATEDLTKENVRYSQPSSSEVKKHVRYSRHLSSQYKPTPSNVRSQLIIHATIRSPRHNRRQTVDKSIDAEHNLHSVR